MLPERLIIFGDLHGQLDKALDCWEQIRAYLGTAVFDETPVVFLGDFCDRGGSTSLMKTTTRRINIFSF